jgi:biotin operon repressor
MARPTKYVPLNDIEGLITLVKKGWDYEKISKYYKERGLDIGRMTISRKVQELKDKGLL